MIELIRTKGTPLLETWLQSPCNVLYYLAKNRPGKNLDIEIGGATFHLVQDADTAREILRNRTEIYCKYFGSYSRLFGESRLTVNGDKWRKLRGYSQSYITETDANAVLKATKHFFREACDNLLTQSNGVEYAVDEALDFAAAATVSKMVLGFPIEDWGPEAISDIRKILRLASWENFPQPTRSGVDEAFLTLDAEDAKLDLQARFAKLLTERDKSNSRGLVNDLAKADPADVDIFGELATLLFAGFDTTASSLAWSMFLLAKDPALQSKLRASVRGMSTDEGLEAADVLALQDLNAFFLEAMRIFPPIPVLSRTLAENDQIGDWALVKGRRVLISIIGVQQDSSVFPNPLDVRLERHPKGSLAKETAGNFVPFGDGKRVCPGARFANLEALVALVVILDTMQLEPVPDQSLKLRWDASMRQVDGTKIIMTPLR
ncbi:cytochrome P450 [Yoonia sp. I 8.24]|uniref:cytochrome P450 n=1 Tax=Yoonia sp. I 8.24 TaxID=1537229 RepID=UPI001EDED2C9|nr:cytochrome P450 [Yoonia sp. I 8.24]MCG3267365.1 cytochrome P450 [Yoonia sp. I 8.24]